MLQFLVSSCGSPYPSSPRAYAWLLAVERWLDDIRVLRPYSCLFLCQPIFTAVNMVNNFADQFIKMEAENAQLRKDLAAAKSSTEQVEAANRLAEEAWQKNEDLEKELAKVKAEPEKEVTEKEKAKALAEEREERLRESIESLLGKFLFCFPCLAPPFFMSLRFAGFSSWLDQLLPILLWIARTGFGSRLWRTPSPSPRTPPSSWRGCW